MTENIVRISGNPTSKPERFQFPNSDDYVVRFGFAHTPRYFDKRQNEWVDGKTSFLEVEIKGGTANADNVLALVETKTKLEVSGELAVETWEKRDGGTGSKTKLKNAKARPDWDVRQPGVENTRTGQHGGSYDRGFTADRGSAGAQPPESDRWAQPTGGYDWETAQPGADRFR